MRAAMVWRRGRETLAICQGEEHNHRATIRAFYEEIWNKHDTAKIPELLQADFAFRGSLGQERHGHVGFAAYVDFVHAALGDYRCEIQEVICEGSVCSHVVLREASWRVLWL